MTARADAARLRIAARLGAAALATAALAAAVVAFDARRGRVETVAGPALPEWSAAAEQAGSLRVVSTDGVITAVRGPDGWRVVDHGGYPVAPRALGALDDALRGLAYSGARTRDPRNHARLGVDDPADGSDGAGVRLTVTGADDAVLLDAIFGRATGGARYLRRVGDAQTYALTGNLPDMASPAFWMDLDVPALGGEAARVAVTPPDGGAPYVVARARVNTPDFALTDPESGWRLLTASAANSVGGAAKALVFSDVRTDSEAGAPIAEHAVTMFDGVTIVMAILERDDGLWARLSVTADMESAADAAEATNARVAGWLFKLAPDALARLAPPLTGVAEPIPEPAEDPTDAPQ